MCKAGAPRQLALKKWMGFGAAMRGNCPNFNFQLSLFNFLRIFAAV